MSKRRGIVLAGGTGSRLFPLTHSVSKQLLPVYDKPMIFYPISLLIEAGVEEIAIITSPPQRDMFEQCLGDGRSFGVKFEYIIQPSPDGLVQAYLLAEDFLDGAPSALALGDNLFCGEALVSQISEAAAQPAECTVFGYPVLDPQNYGVATFDANGRAVSIEEKPHKPRSDFAVTGLYLLDGDAPLRARNIRPSPRGELEITDLLQSYLDDGKLNVTRLSAGRWFDTGAPLNLLDAGNYVRNQLIQRRLVIGSPELSAFRRGLISCDQMLRRAATMHATDYGRMLRDAAIAGSQAPDNAHLSIA